MYTTKQVSKHGAVKEGRVEVKEKKWADGEVFLESAKPPSR